MIQRRHFIGSATAMLAAAATRTTFGSTSLPLDNLNWHSEVIETVAHNKALRRPVVTDVSLQPGGNLLAVVGDDHYVCIYDMTTENFTHHLDKHVDWIRSARFSPNGQLLATAGNDRRLYVWSVNNWSVPAFSKHHPQAIIEVAFSPDGKQLATVGFEGTSRIYDSATGDLLQELDCACPDNHAVAFSPDGKMLAAGGRSGEIRVWERETDTYRQMSQFKAHRKRIRSIQFTPGGNIVSAGDDQIVRFTNPKTQATRALPRHASKLYSAKLLHDGLCATGGSDNRIHIWQASTQTEIGTLTGHTGTVSCLDYSDGKLVSGSFDTHVRLWSTESHTSTPRDRQTNLNGRWNRKLN